MIQLAWENGIEPMLVLTPFTQGVFNNQLIQTLVEEESVRENVITNLLKVVEEKGYVGVDVDFEYVRAQNREVILAEDRKCTSQKQRGCSVRKSWMKYRPGESVRRETDPVQRRNENSRNEKSSWFAEDGKCF